MTLKDIPPFQRGPLIDNWQRRQPICDPAEKADIIAWWKAGGGWVEWDWLRYKRGELPVRVKVSPVPKSKGVRKRKAVVPKLVLNK